MMDVAGIDIGLARRTGPRDQIGIAGRVDDDLGEHSMAAFLSLTERPAGGTSSFPLIPCLTANICAKLGNDRP
jgi:hypothetical protein